MSDLLARLTGRIRDAIHGECYATVALQHDAVVAGAAAHHQAETELAQARQENAALEERLAEVERLLTAAPLPLTRPHLEGESPLHAAVGNLALIRMVLRAEARADDPGSAYGEHLHGLADALQGRVMAAIEAVRGGQDPDGVLADLQAPLATVPGPRTADPVTA